MTQPGSSYWRCGSTRLLQNDFFFWRGGRGVGGVEGTAITFLLGHGTLCDAVIRVVLFERFGKQNILLRRS